MQKQCNKVSKKFCKKKNCYGNNKVWEKKCFSEENKVKFQQKFKAGIIENVYTH